METSSAKERKAEENSDNMGKSEENSQSYSSQYGNMGSPGHGNQKTYANVQEYARDLQSWMFQYRMWTSFCAVQSKLLASMPPPQTFQATPPQNRGQSNSSSGNTTVNGQTQPNLDLTGTQYKVPMLWKRIAAECLDFILLFYTKILVTVAVLRQMGYVNENFLDLDAQLPILGDLGEMDYEKMFSLTSELIALEVVNRLCITLVETMCLRKGYAGSIGGATPGKKIMKLRVVSFDEIRDTGNGNVIVYGARDPGLINALIRSMIKNFSLAFFFPACFTVFFFRFNRAAYDILTQTIVVEIENRRPRQ